MGPEEVTGPGVGGLHISLLAPDAARAGEDIGRPSVRSAVIRLVPVNPRGRAGLSTSRHEHRVTPQGDVDPEPVTGLRVGALHRGLLAPDAARAGENIDRPTVLKGGSADD